MGCIGLIRTKITFTLHNFSGNPRSQI